MMTMSVQKNRKAEKQAAIWHGAEANQDPWMICHRGEVFDSAVYPSPYSSLLERRIKIGRERILKNPTVKKYCEPFDEQVKYKCHKDDFLSLKKDGLRIHRSRLEKDVLRLQARLQQEQKLHSAFQATLMCRAGASFEFSCKLPNDVQELLRDIATLEVAVSKLEEDLIFLQCLLRYEHAQCKEINYISGLFTPKDKSQKSEGTRIDENSEMHLCSDLREASDLLQEENLPPSRLLPVRRPCDQHHWFCIDLRKQPNKLSEIMVRCMIDIYSCLLNRAKDLSNSQSLVKTSSPTSPLGLVPSPSQCSLLESSLLSSSRSPLIDMRKQENTFGTQNFLNIYQSPGKDLLPRNGNYHSAVEISWTSAGIEQLEYAAKALREFKVLVEQLAQVNPQHMKHAEKVAFWINLYNALLMHACLAYGIPKSQSEFSSLLQKARYRVGGHPFNAVTIKYNLLRQNSNVHNSHILTDEQLRFAIDHDEPFVNFALCFGAHSSPMIHVYTPNNIQKQLQSSQYD